MKTIYLSGQWSFENRGCDAIVRSTAMIIRQKFGQVHIRIPSTNINRDAQQWPEHEDYGVQFVPAYSPVNLSRAWKITRSLPGLKNLNIVWPVPLPLLHKKLIRTSDAVVSVGGDNYSLDYFSYPGHLMAHDLVAIDGNIPTLLWAASAGPFSSDNPYRVMMLSHFKDMSAITARESITYKFLAESGLDKLSLTADPAFLLPSEAVDFDSYWPKASANGTIGINVSPLAARARYTKNRATLDVAITEYVRWLVTRAGLSVIFVPHVEPIGNISPRNNDRLFIKNRILPQLADLAHSVSILPPDMNASQIKYAISKCNYFIGARTHSTIAALSSCVPTISISYSTKARGINTDLFSCLDYVIDTSKVTTQQLIAKTELLIQNSADIRSTLFSAMPAIREKAALNAEVLAKVLGR